MSSVACSSLPRAFRISATYSHVTKAYYGWTIDQAIACAYLPLNTPDIICPLLFRRNQLCHQVKQLKSFRVSCIRIYLKFIIICTIKTNTTFLSKHQKSIKQTFPRPSNKIHLLYTFLTKPYHNSTWHVASQQVSLHP